MNYRNLQNLRKKLYFFAPISKFTSLHHFLACVQCLILVLISHINYGMLLWGSEIGSVKKYQKKAIRNITNSHILAHTEPLLKNLGLLKVGDIFKLRLLKIYYKMINNELPLYFMTYVPMITNEAYVLNHDYAVQTGARPAICTP